MIRPKILLDQTRMTADVAIEAEAGEIVIRPARSPREGWDKSFRSMAARGDDRLLDEAMPASFDDEEWEWKCGAFEVYLVFEPRITQPQRRRGERQQSAL